MLAGTYTFAKIVSLLGGEWQRSKTEEKSSYLIESTPLIVQSFLL
jgi:hypothetical protein